VDGAVALAWRPRHDGDASGKQVIPDQFQIGRTAAEESRKLVLESAVDAVKRVLEARARLAVDLADRLLERVQCIGQVGELPIQVFLAFGLLLELVD
jgi:hypothetical protein